MPRQIKLKDVVGGIKTNKIIDKHDLYNGGFNSCANLNVEINHIELRNILAIKIYDTAYKDLTSLSKNDIRSYANVITKSIREGKIIKLKGVEG